jgi:hypothetical protein
MKETTMTITSAITVGAEVKYLVPFADEIAWTYRVIELNGDRGFMVPIGTGLNFPGTILFRTEDIVKVVR